MTDFVIMAQRSPTWDDTEARRRLGRAYRIILEYDAKKETADGRECGNLTRTAAEATAPDEAVPA